MEAAGYSGSGAERVGGLLRGDLLVAHLQGRRGRGFRDSRGYLGSSVGSCVSVEGRKN